MVPGRGTDSSVELQRQAESVVDLVHFRATRVAHAAAESFRRNRRRLFDQHLRLLGYTLAALIMFVLIITIPWGIAAARIGVYALWPFGKTVVSTPNAGLGSFLGNVLWVVLVGWWIALTHLTTGIALCITIIGIPMGIANFKLIPVALLPLGKEIVDLP
jgi:uncharacterized membrane protein YccF (DUF307 family)